MAEARSQETEAQWARLSDEERVGALASLAADAPAQELPAVLSLFTMLPRALAEAPDAIYARGLVHWRSGNWPMALDAWDQLPSEAAEAMRGDLERARVWYGEELLREDRPAQALLQLSDLRGPLSPAARAARRQAVLECLRQGHTGLVRKAARDMAQSDDPADRALAAFATPSGTERMVALAQAARDAGDSQLKSFCARTAAAEALLADDRQAAALILEEHNAQAGALASLRALAAVGGGHLTQEQLAELPWQELKALGPASAGILRLLLTPPLTADPEEAASHWIERAEQGRAYEALAALQRADPCNPDLARHLGVIAYIQAMQACPRIDEDAWKKCFAQLCCFLANPEWLEDWIAGRLAVYEQAADPAALAKELRLALERLLDDGINRLGIEARDRRGEAREQIRRLKLLCVWERQAADALWKAGGLRVRGTALAFGPLFAEALNLGDELAAYFAETGEEDKKAERRQRLLKLTEGWGLDKGALRRFLQDEGAGNRDALRQWFSSLGEAKALTELGQFQSAYEQALQVYALYGPPPHVSPEEFHRANPSYGRDGSRRFADDVGALVCEINGMRMDQAVGHGDYALESFPADVRRWIAQASAFDWEKEMRGRLLQAVLGKHQRLVENKDPEELAEACLLMRRAERAGLNPPGDARALSAIALGHAMKDQKRWRQAVEAFEEAWSCLKTEASIPCNLVALVLRWREVLQEEKREEEARQALNRAVDIETEASQLFPNDERVQELAATIRQVAAGLAPSRLFNFGGETEAAYPTARDLPPAAVEAIKECQAARRAEEMEAAFAAARRAQQAAPNHPDPVSIMAQIGLDLARPLAEGEKGRAMFREIEEALEPVYRRYPGHWRLRSAWRSLCRERILFSDRVDAAAALHRKGLKSLESGEAGDAVRALQAAFFVSEQRDPDVIALLAEALLEDSRAGHQDMKAADNARIMAAKYLAIGRESFPDHLGLQRARNHLTHE